MKAMTFLMGGLVTLAACMSPVVPDDQKRPEDVRTGMSIQQLDHLMGRPTEACWKYERGQNDYDSICFRKDLVDTITKVRPKPGTPDIYIDAALAGTATPKPPLPSAAEVGFWMGPAQVTRIKGKPSSIDAYYARGKGEYYARFKNGIVARFAPVTYRCVHGLCTRDIAE